MSYNKCIDCPYHKVMPDPDPTDWFNRDDVAIVCQKSLQNINLNSNYLVDQQKFRGIDVALRPYQVSKVKPPSWCPISILNIRESKINKIFNDV